MATRNFNWPATVVAATNPSVGLTGTPAPTSATEIGGVNGGNLVAVAVNADGSLVIDSTLDKNFGVVGLNTLRTAAEIGNATGAASFAAGATGAQTLRVEANQGAAQAIATAWTVKPTDGTNSQGYTAAGEAKVSVTQPVPAGTNIIGKVGIDQTTPGTTNGVQVNAALPAGSNVIGHVITDTGSTVAVSNFPATQPVSGTVAATQSGTWTVQPGNTANTTAWLVNGTGGTFPATQSGTWNITNISGTVSLPTGASTSALQTTANTSLSSIDGKFGSLGQKTMAGSAPVVIASDQAAIPVTGSFSLGGGTAFTHAVVQLTAVTATQIFASNGSRKISTFINNSGATIWVGASNVSNTSTNLGIPVLPNNLFQWTNTAALYGYSVAGTSGDTGCATIEET